MSYPTYSPATSTFGRDETQADFPPLGTAARNYEQTVRAESVPAAGRLGDKLVRMGIITGDQLQIGLHEQRQKGLMLGSTLIQLGFLDEKTLAAVLSARTGHAPVDLDRTILDPHLVRTLPRATAEKCLALPLMQDGSKLDLAIADPYDVVAMDEVRRYFPRPIDISLRIAPKAAILDAIARVYGQQNRSVDSILSEMETAQTPAVKPVPPRANDPDHPVVQLVNTLLADALDLNASDIHLEPESHFVRVRFRIDGRLRRMRDIHKSHWTALSQRIKVMASMNIADQRSIQDGRFQMTHDAGAIDFRVAIMPSIAGETIVIRLLDHRRALLSLDALGFDPASVEGMKRMMDRPEGLILATGPTGSGKTTTLYALLREIANEDTHIATLEDPVEYQIEGVRQTSLNDMQGLDFAAGVRGLLRMDPDVLFIGEIRDADAAQMAMRASLTGHQVYSTLHCHDALSALPRLMDLGLSPRMIAENLNGIVAQRLVRTLCPHCKQRRRASVEEARVLRCDPAALPLLEDPVGCDACGGTGYKGRTVIAEFLPMTAELADMLVDGAPRSTIFKRIRQMGFRTLQENGIARVLAGGVSLPELRRTLDLNKV